MAIIVDKVQKRKDIALACKDLFLEKGFKQLTISDVAKTAGVGKGTVYEYFQNKEDIIFEIVNILISIHDERKIKQMQQVNTAREKIKVFARFFYNQEDSELRKLYKEFISISLIDGNPQMIALETYLFHKYLEWFESLIQEGIDKGELIPEAMNLSQGLFISGDGFFIKSSLTKDAIDLEKELCNYVDAIFKLIEVKK
ncbi:TetR/AcrR family transcriptional regulator [Sulfurimonas sp.]|uniref:TetR/AcrR family transcriptional regulator n=1 Tax=Sulfurimonas sp. TaxID=2022749 RepID=UPI003D0E9CB9